MKENIESYPQNLFFDQHLSDYKIVHDVLKLTSIERGFADIFQIYFRLSVVLNPEILLRY